MIYLYSWAAAGFENRDGVHSGWRTFGIVPIRDGAIRNCVHLGSCLSGKKQVFQKVQLSFLLIVVTWNTNWSGVDNSFKNKSCTMSNAV